MAQRCGKTTSNGKTCKRKVGPTGTCGVDHTIKTGSYAGGRGPIHVEPTADQEAAIEADVFTDPVTRERWPSLRSLHRRRRRGAAATTVGAAADLSVASAKVTANPAETAAKITD